MKEYKDPVVNVIAFDADIITTSGNPIETEPTNIPLAANAGGPADE